MCDKTCGVCGSSTRSPSNFFSKLGEVLAATGKVIWSGIKWVFGKISKFFSGLGHKSHHPVKPPHHGVCKDMQPSMCRDRFTFNPSFDCELTPGICDKTCGCCGANPKHWCRHLHHATQNTTDIITV